MPGIGNAIGIPFKKGGGISWSSYWETRYISALLVLTTSDTEQTVTATIVGTGYDGVSYEYSTDNVTFTEHGTSATGTYNATGLTAGNTYYWKARLYKGTNYGDYSDFAYAYISTLLTGLVEYWHLNESSGNATGVNGNVLTNVNSATYGTGKNNNSVSFGTPNTNKALQINSNLGLTYASSRSISFWFKSLNITEDSRYPVSILFATNPGNYTLIKQKANTLRTTTDAVLLTPISLNTWHHIVITHNHGGNTIRYYIDGTYRGNEASWTGNYSALTTRFSLGNFNNGGFCSCEIDDVVVHNRIITDDEILESFRDSISKFHPFDNRTELINNAAYCWFTPKKILYDSASNKTWIGIVYKSYLSSDPYTTLLELNNITGLVTTNKVEACNDDDHEEPSLIIRTSDNKLIAAWCEHGYDSNIYYKISTNAKDASAWGVLQTLTPNAPNLTSYANIFEVDNGDIYIFYRDMNLTSWCYVKSTDGGSSFGAFVEFSEAYYNIICQDPNDKDIIHFIGSEHPNLHTTPNYVMHFYFNAGTGTWHKSDDTNITASIPIGYNDASVIFTNTEPAQAWIEDLIVDGNGLPRVLLTYIPDTSIATPLKYLYYSEWNGSAWSTPYQVHLATNRNVGGATEIYYSNLACFDKSNPIRIIASKDVSGVSEIFEIVRVSASSFTSEQKTTDSTYDQWRPISSGAKTYNILWLNKILYNNWDDFNQQLFHKSL